MGDQEYGPEAIISDQNVDRLEQMIKDQPSRPDTRRRLTRQLIERLRVSERAAAIVMIRYMKIEPQEVIRMMTLARMEAREELREKGIIR